jgi:hypothetical protein
VDGGFMKKIASVFFLLVSCAATGLLYFVELPIYSELLISALAIVPPMYILLEKHNRWTFLRQVPHYGTIVGALLVLFILSSFAPVIPALSFYHPANDDFIYFYSILNCVNCFLLMLNQFRPELLHLKDLPEENEP